ncbi:MAG: Rv0909 family putative TA system antitoxin [Actinomycetota bacterium]
MGLFDKVKGIFGSNAEKIEDAVEDGIDKAAELAKDKLPGDHDDKIDMAADKAADMADKIDGEEG